MRSKIMTLASTAIPTVKIRPEMPGSVKVASNAERIANTRIRFHKSAKEAMNQAP